MNYAEFMFLGGVFAGIFVALLGWLLLGIGGRDDGRDKQRHTTNAGYDSEGS